MSGLLIPNTFDPKGKTNGVARAQTLGSAGEQTVLSISGSGYLIGITMSVRNDGYLKLVIDGVEKLSISNVLMSNAYGSSNGMSFIMRFKSSLLITHKAGTSGETVYTHVMYLLD